MNIWCRLFGHDDHSTTYEQWKETGMNFKCDRCGKEGKTVEDMK